MRPYRFMTGAHSYRIHAESRSHALELATEALNPSPEALKVIEKTLYEEGAEKAFQSKPFRPSLAYSRPEEDRTQA